MPVLMNSSQSLHGGRTRVCNGTKCCCKGKRKGLVSCSCSWGQWDMGMALLTDTICYQCLPQELCSEKLVAGGKSEWEEEWRCHFFPCAVLIMSHLSVNSLGATFLGASPGCFPWPLHCCAANSKACAGAMKRGV